MNPTRLFTIILFLTTTSWFLQAQPRIIEAAASEFFIEIPQRGRFSVSLGEETIINSNGRFRFFSVYDTRVPLIIKTDNRILYEQDIFIKPGTRSIAVFSRNRVNVIKDLPLENMYLNNWDKCIEDSNAPTYGTNTRYLHFPSAMSPESFYKFIQSIKSNPFDKDKLTLIDVAAINAVFTTDQILEIVNLFSFTDEKLLVVKKLYPSVADPENGFQLVDAFIFSQDKEKVKRVLLAGNYNYQRYGR